MLYLKFKDNRTSGSGEEDFKDIYHMQALLIRKTQFQVYHLFAQHILTVLKSGT